MASTPQRQLSQDSYKESTGSPCSGRTAYTTASSAPTSKSETVFGSVTDSSCNTPGSVATTTKVTLEFDESCEVTEETTIPLTTEPNTLQQLPDRNESKSKTLLQRLPSLRLNRFGSGKSKNKSPAINLINDEEQGSESPPVSVKEKTKSEPFFIGDDASLYGTPKEELLPKSDTRSNTPSTTNFLKDQILTFFQPSDNRLAMKLFGNKSALIKERQRQRATGTWIIHPCSNFRFYWDLFMLLMLIANLIILPVAISFFNDDLSIHWVIFNCASDTVFLLDIFINFRTGVLDADYADEIILEPKKIAISYIKSWFFLDLISSLPLDYIFLMFDPNTPDVNQLMQAGRALRILRFAKLLSLLRLLRLSRLVRYVSQWEEFLSVAGVVVRIFNLICLMLLLGHWNGCLQYLVPMLQEFPPDCWVAIEELTKADWKEQYTWALFKALSHMLCIGYGRWPPQNVTDVTLTIISMLTGATCYALFVGHATTLIQSFDTGRRLFREKYKQVEEYMSYRRLPRDLRGKIADFYEHKYRGKMFDEDAILNDLSETLRESVVNHNCRALVANVPFFTNADPHFVTEVISKLKYEVCQPKDFIIKEGTRGDKMYFIQEGIVDIITKDGEVATSLSDGSYFGEICLLTNAKRVASVYAETYCNLFSLSVEDFNKILEHYPLMRRTLESVAAQRLSKIGKDANMMSTVQEEDVKAMNQIIQESASLRSDTGSNSPDEKRRESKKYRSSEFLEVDERPHKQKKKRLSSIFKAPFLLEFKTKKDRSDTTCGEVHEEETSDIDDVDDEYDGSDGHSNSKCKGTSGGTSPLLSVPQGTLSTYHSVPSFYSPSTDKVNGQVAYVNVDVEEEEETADATANVAEKESLV
ncbi:potassium/sodium hyperpolarization-activated cyclic nucleotide-gated channel 3-like [Lingula anatina]|uniref:Potassium/sodium hyperpolarization-activated cyclic nucleotide-gated channel 3-like n=1 Tax=Lingula anatina TaxID=7574 RepID=A0A1S3HUX8_LINAN|nr:potassium/sodium hyperpolarization-activated cyclic nucleotide-gated channel 3-like [Lingula anatina]|eukprot:XP_013389823.1 potassium/sodium hyperpolarization-activated cyclic nucleotide-gated channel 3-like [Lingula anatina]